MTSWEPLALEDLSHATVHEIRRDNLLDLRLWETWREAKEPSGRCLLSREAVRFVNQVVRRIQRRWGVFDGSEAAPLEGGGSIVPVQG